MKYWEPGGKEPQEVPGSWMLFVASLVGLVFAIVYAYWRV